MTTKIPEHDAALMRAFAARDQGAADALYQRFASRIYGLGIVMLGSDAAAQDLVQDTFVKVFRSADRYDRTEANSTRGYCSWHGHSRSTRSVAGCWRSDLWGNREPWKRPEAGPDALAAMGDLADRASEPWPAGPEQRAALGLAYFGGKTSAEVAEMEGIPVGTAKTRIRTALTAARGHVGGHPSTCDRVRERLPELVLGTLSDDEEARSGEHLRGCAGLPAGDARARRRTGLLREGGARP